MWLLIIAGVLLYFSDGLLPLLQAYYEDFFDPPQDAYNRERQMDISARIAAALLVCDGSNKIDYLMNSQPAIYLHVGNKLPYFF